MKDIRMKWNKKESDIEVNWNAGSGRDAGFFIELIPPKILKEIKDRGYDIETIKFSITKCSQNTGENNG